ncbi:MAG: hypothetical protein DMF59_06640 [Acidobacteria bacterium]|nr:MAG: hypothetical protein DMF59_06640 [Acidobacteriota bacterium]
MKSFFAVSIGILLIVCAHQARHRQPATHFLDCRSTIIFGEHPEVEITNQLIAYETGGGVCPTIGR